MSSRPKLLFVVITLYTFLVMEVKIIIRRNIYIRFILRAAVSCLCATCMVFCMLESYKERQLSGRV